MRILLLILPLLTACETLSWDYRADLVDRCSARTGYCHWSGSPKGGSFPAPTTANPPPTEVGSGVYGFVQGVHEALRANGH